MHEIGIMQSTLEVVRRQADAHGARQIARLVLRIGALSGVEPDALRFAFEVLAPNSIAAGSALEIELVPARAHCQKCRQGFTMEHSFILSCPQCGELSADVIQGRELELARIDFFIQTP